MTCFHPLKAQRTLTRLRVLGAVTSDDELSKYLVIPCGQCVGCRLKRSCDWATRCVHESQMHESSVFITLTYDVEHLSSWSLRYRDFQLFMKRLRKRGAVRFYMCGEYGENCGRPHFHALLFGCFFADRVFFRELPSGGKIYTSVELSKLWPFGFSSIGDVTFESAAYVARYACKSAFDGHDGKRVKVTDGAGFVDYETGEFVPFVREFTRMSLKPGIGAEWFKKFGDEVKVHGGAVIGGRIVGVPKYYDRLMEAAGDFCLDYLKYLRSVEAEKRSGDAVLGRLAVRETCAKARLRFKERTL